MGNEAHRTVSHRSEEQKKQLSNRLNRIEGQVRGIQKMIEEDRYCVDILVQITAVQSALKNVGMQVLENHTHHCVANAIQSGEGKEAIDELMKVFNQFSRT
ncbi:metal-sensing transcriptional repressor [Bacillus sp. REN10]|uniref:metal-sensing transcriptional repressor n=1 Tax=Bacillus sp. REN10 TaxID=2782541 RepID=UPI00193B28B5|nr:metal-sensing transcriptional repressor [Bacillus sp. REN10]